MKKRHKNILHKCYQLGSLLLVLLFLSISVIQAIHTHKRSAQTEQSAVDDDIVFEKDQCKICDYFMHQQGKQEFYSFSYVLVAPLPDVISYHTHTFIGNYKFTLQGFTNKGPPRVAS
ncbi:MAG: hypothetical protein ABWY16_14860 [Pedobacter sp.]